MGELESGEDQGGIEAGKESGLVRWLNRWKGRITPDMAVEETASVFTKRVGEWRKGKITLYAAYMSKNKYLYSI